MALIAFSLLFLLSGFSAGEKYLPQGPLDVMLGKDLNINLLLPTGDNDSIGWSFTDKTIGSVGSGKVTIQDPYKSRAVIYNNGSLTVKSLKSEDTGVYELSIFRAGVFDQNKVEVRVIEPVSDVMIKSDLPEAIENNSTVVLTCSSKGTFLSFSWTNDSKIIAPDDKRLSEKGSKLTFTGVQKYDLVGPIVCTASNPLQKASSANFNLTTYYGPYDVIIKASSQKKYVPSNSDFNLTCSASSKPAATFTWFFNAVQIKATGPVLTLKVIEEQGLGHTMGNYKCVAKNDKTKREVSSTDVQFSVMEAISGVKLSGPKGILIAGNSSANLTCRAEGGNVTDRVWLKDGEPLSPDSHVTFSSDRTSINIDVLKKDDNGNYTCQFSNSVSTKEASFQMVVNYGPETPEVKGNKEVQLKTRVELTCSVSSVPPANITWMLNGTVIPFETKETLIYNEIDYKSSGTYTCEASNKVTGQSTKSQPLSVTVKEKIDEGLSDGAIAGIVIACLVAVGAAIALFFYCRGKVPVSSPY